jgi:hypothetical protein
MRKSSKSPKMFSKINFAENHWWENGVNIILPNTIRAQNLMTPKICHPFTPSRQSFSGNCKAHILFLRIRNPLCSFRLTKKALNVSWKEIMRFSWKAQCSTTMFNGIAIWHKLVVCSVTFPHCILWLILRIYFAFFFDVKGLLDTKGESLKGVSISLLPN